MDTFLRIFLLVIISVQLGNAQDWTRENIVIAETFEEASTVLAPVGDKIHVVNFWATWCKPCVAELPFIEGLHEVYSEDELCVSLVSLDFKKDIDTKYLDFLNENKIKSDNLILLDGKYNNWIDKVDPEWSGAIPITLIFKGDKRLFYEGEFHSTQDIIELINTLN